MRNKNGKSSNDGKTTDLERGLFGKTFSTLLVKKDGHELLLSTTIRPLNRRVSQYTIIESESKRVLHSGENLSKACLKFTNFINDEKERQSEKSDSN